MLQTGIDRTLTPVKRNDLKCFSARLGDICFYNESCLRFCCNLQTFPKIELVGVTQVTKPSNCFFSFVSKQ